MGRLGTTERDGGELTLSRPKLLRPANGANNIILTTFDGIDGFYSTTARPRSSNRPGLRSRTARLQLHLHPHRSRRDTSCSRIEELNDPNAPRSRWVLQAAADATLRLHHGPCDLLSRLRANNAPGLCHGLLLIASD
jgi:hypothetical protein